jgi:MraZ protein
VVIFALYLAFKTQNVVNLNSTYECKVDNKGRVMLPGKLKEELAEALPNGFILKRSVFSRCIELWPKEEWDQELAKINKLNRYDKDNARFIRKFLAGVKAVEVDGTGRINIPNELIKFAGITKSIVITPQISILEMWDKEKYEQEVGFDDDGDEDFGDLAQKVMGSKKSETD